MRLIFMIAALLPFMASADNFFRNGMTWEYEVEADGPSEYPVRHTIYKLVGDTVVDGYDSTRMYMEEVEYESPTKFLAFIRTEGDKVYFKLDYPEEEWSLLYDFGLKAGDETYVDWLTSFPDAGNRHLVKWVSCLKVEESVEYSGMETMVMANEYSDEMFDFSFGEWLNGIGSTFLLCYGSGFGMSGGASRLTKASMNGETICEYQKAKVEIDENDNRYVSVLSLDGRIIYEGIKTFNNLKDLVCESGIYVVKTGNTVRKHIIL